MADFIDNIGDFIASRLSHVPEPGPLSPLSPSSSLPQDASLSSWATLGGYDHPQPGSRLLQYGMLDKDEVRIAVRVCCYKIRVRYRVLNSVLADLYIIVALRLLSYVAVLGEGS
jgi:hypothetical protein